MADSPADTSSPADRIHRKKESRSAFSVDSEDLSNLSKLLRHFGPDRWQVELSDGTVREGLDLNQVLALPNGPSARVIKVAAIATRGTSVFDRGSQIFNDSTKAVIELNSAAFISPCKFEAAGEEQLIDAFWKRMHDWLQDVKPGYSWITRASNTLWIAISSSAAISLVAYLVLLYILNKYLTPLASTAIGVVLALIVAFSSGSLLELICPRGEFAIGGGKKRSKTLKAVRSALGAMFILAVASSMVASFFWEKL